MNRPHKIDYSRRTVDLLLLKTVTRPVSETVVDPNVADVPMAVTGIEKLVQRYALLFLTQIGTVEGSPDEGSEFMRSLGRGMIYDESTLKAEAAKANSLVTRQIRREDAELETADDEALESATITDLKLDRFTKSVVVQVTIVTRAGSSYTYITPITIGV